jgi:hypothetical protein
MGVSVFSYEVMGLPPNRKIRVSVVYREGRSTGRWQILPITVIRDSVIGHETWVLGQWTGEYESAEAALASIDESFLQDKQNWNAPP